MVTGDREASAPRGKNEGERCPRWEGTLGKQSAETKEAEIDFQVPLLRKDGTFQT